MGLFGSLFHAAVKGFEVFSTPFVAPIATVATLGGEALDGIVQGGLWAGSKIADLFGSKWHYKFSPMQLVLVGGLLGGAITVLSPMVRNDLIGPGLKEEAKLLGLTAGKTASAPPGTLMAVCGPTTKAPDGNTYQTVAAVVPNGQTPTNPYETDPKTGTTVELGLAPQGACTQGEHILVTPAEMEKSAGLVQALVQAQGK